MLLQKRRARRNGFTLIEILVALIILSLLVAATFPVVVQQIERAEPTRAGSDLASVRTGLELFRANLRSAWPGDLEDLVNRLIAADPASDADILGVAFTASHANRWDGPYTDAILTQAGTETITTGYEGQIQRTVFCYVTTTNAVTSGAACDAANADFIAVRVDGLSDVEHDRINDLIDGATDAGFVAGIGDTTGRFRRDITSQSFYLAVPFRL